VISEEPEGEKKQAQKPKIVKGQEIIAVLINANSLEPIVRFLMPYYIWT
jgi:hypothetical protein